MEGNPEKGELAFHECLRLAHAAGNHALAAHTTMVVAMGLCIYGQLHGAARLYQSIIHMGARAAERLFHPAGQGYIGLASIYLEWNDLETAEDDLKRGIELCRAGGMNGVSIGYTID
jgi:hypothetical protein